MTPLAWAESTDPKGNSTFEALSHLCANEAGEYSDFWTVRAHLENNEAVWRLQFTDVATTPAELQTLVEEGWFMTSKAAMQACEEMETKLGGADRAPRVPTDHPDQSPPLTVDDHGFAPTRTIRSRWSRNEGVLYLFRVWAKPEDAEQTIEKRLEGDEYDAALPAYVRQQMVSSLVASVTQSGGWIVPLVWRTAGLGEVRMECEVMFVGVKGLYWARDAKPGRALMAENFQEIEAPSHRLICSIVGEQLNRQRQEYDKKLAGTTEDQLRREIMRNARAVGLKAEAPAPESEIAGNVLPITLEHLLADGIDLRGDALRGKTS